MVPDFVLCCAVSKWLSALPTGGSKRIRALPGGTADRALPGQVLAPFAPRPMVWRMEEAKVKVF